MDAADLFHEGERITTRQAGRIAAQVIHRGGIDTEDMIGIFRRAVEGEAEAADEFFDLTGIEVFHNAT